MRTKKSKTDRTTAKDPIYRPKSFTTRTYNLWISQFIDRYNYGYLTEDNVKKFRFTKQYINECFKSKDPYTISRIKLTEAMMDDHLKGTATYFYTSKRKSNIALLVIDLDPAENSTFQDIQQAAEYIVNRFHPGAYWEISTTGRGIHIYILVDFSGFKRTEANSIISTAQNSYAKLLSQLINSMYFCKLDQIKGTYSSDMNYKNRGTLCKLPRPQTKDEFFQLTNMPVLTLTDIVANVRIIEELLDDDYNSYTIPSPSLAHSDIGTPGSSSLVVSSAGAPVQPGSGPDHYTCINILSTNNGSPGGPEDKKQQNNENKCIKKMVSDDALQKTLYSVMYLAQRLGRLPDYAEWNQFYINQGLNTGEETPERERRYNNVRDYVESTFNPAIYGRWYSVGEFTEDLNTRITPDELKEICENMNIKDMVRHMDLDVGMGYHWLCMLTNHEEGRELTVPVDGMIAFFKSLKQVGLISRSCNYNKVRAVRTALLRIGYITLLDDNYVKGYTKAQGVAMKWGIGENCPRYGDFLTFVGNDMVKKVTNGTRQARMKLVE